MKSSKFLSLLLVFLFLFSACGQIPVETHPNAVKILLADKEIQVDGAPVSGKETQGVYTANDIVYYESGKDFTYGEGTEKDAHTKAEAAAHTVVHITKAGTYSLQGTLSKGQIAVDLGKDAKKDPNAVVTLILNGVNITCNVAPAIIFYNVYECGNTDTETATKDVDTTAAGANVIIADDTENTVNGSYVERIYDPETVVLNDDKTQVEDADKLHKYDGAFYSKMSMNIGGGEKGNGVLNINAQNEGLDSELHLTLNGGVVNIKSGNDGINTNEDEISVTTINNGTLNIQVTGETGEGDGIDSNGWLVINGGNVTAYACSDSGDAGIDSDMGIHLNGGKVIASGNMLDRIQDGGQTYATFNFAQKQNADTPLTLKDADQNIFAEFSPVNNYSILIYSSPDLKEGDYTLWQGDKQLAGQGGGMMGRPQKPDGTGEDMTPPQGEENRPMKDGEEPPQMPQGEDFPERQEFSEGMTPPEKPDGSQGEHPDFQQKGEETMTESTTVFSVKKGANMFGGITLAE